MEALGYQLLAISPDKPENLKVTADKLEYKISLHSDSKMAAARGFGIAYKLDGDTVKTYKGFGLDLEAISGESHLELPVPAVFLIGTDGIVDFQYINPDYRVRLSPEVVVAAAKASQGGS